MRLVKFLFLIVLALCLGLSASAIPAKRVPFTVMQRDGVVLTVTLVGDESFHYIATLDGIPVVEDGEGFYRLAPELKGEMAAKWKSRMTKRYAARRAKAMSRVEARRAFGHSTSYVGEKRGLVILVNFKDLAMQSEYDQAKWNRQFNQKGYTESGHIGSVRDYFYDQSYGKFDIDFDVVGPVTVSKEYSHYGQNDSEGNDKYPCEMVIEACRAADKEGVNFANYDWDGDGEVDMVFCVYAGYGESAGAPAKTIWPHEWELSSGVAYGDGTGVLTLDGVKIDTYAVSCELTGASGSTMDGIGTACHEFSHCLGLPDMYDTSYSGGFGMGAWDLLDAGAYNGPSMNGEVPAGFTAYERWFAGWLDFQVLSEPCTVTDMPALQDTAFACIFYNDNNPNEGFILENRQNKGWFRYVSYYTTMHGMLAYHVDYNASAWEKNEVNKDAKHQRMSIIPAGKDYGTYYSAHGQYSPTKAEYASQLFPGSMGVTELTNTSHVDYNGKLFNKNTDGTFYMNKPITEITESDGLISFKFMNGADTPEDPEKDVPVLSETMSKMTFTTEHYFDFLKDYDDYFETEGWTGSRFYGNYGKVRLASAIYDGKLDSPQIVPGEDETVTVKVNAAKYHGDSSELIVRILNTNGAQKAEQKVDLTDEDVEYTFDFTNVDYMFKVEFYAKARKRYYINCIKVFTPDVTAISAVDAEDGGVTEYFTLSGVPTTKPTEKGIYIVRQNGTTRKIYIR